VKPILKALLSIVGLVVVVLAVWAFLLTRDGEVVTPQGEGTVAIGETSFEAFPLPDYVASALPSETKSYLVEVEPGIKVHMLELGEGYPVYMQHGNPTNGLLYRKVAAELPADQFRMIMPTMVGLGFSSKVPASQHTLDNHIRWMKTALDQIGVDELIYVGQDWGGPVGMGVLARSPGKLKGAVVMNTGFIAPTEERALSTMHSTVSTPIVGEFMLEGFGSIFPNLPGIQGDPNSMPEGVIDLYGRPVDESDNGKAPLALMRMVPAGPDHPSVEQMIEIQDYVATLDIPAALVWGMQDPILAQGLEPMKAQFPDATVTETEAGHFLQEEVPAEIAQAVLSIYSQIEVGVTEVESNP
jgi:haloalkane dehalogenase